MASVTLAAICSVVIGSGAVTCGEPMPFADAREAVERRVLAQREFWDPRWDPYYYLQPVLPQPPRAAAREPDPPSRYPSRYARTPAPGTMAPIP